MKENALPAGEYWLGDPCYVIKDDQWLDFLKHINRENGSAEFQGHQLTVFDTRHGDGVYQDGAGNLYPVDSGQIGAVPKDLIQREALMHMGRLIDSSSPLVCTDEDGILTFGDTVITT